MITSGMEGVEFIAINTDAQDLDSNPAETKIQIGKDLTKGLGAGAKPEIGRKAIMHDKEAVSSIVAGSDLVFVTAGMGGGTGTGAAPVVAKICKELGILTVCIVTLPFNFEGPKKMSAAMKGISTMRNFCDTLIVIPNEKLLSVIDYNTTLEEGFAESDSVLLQAAQSISDLINKQGNVNIDFADVETVMSGMGDAVMGTGTARGEERAVLAAQQAICSPLLDNQSIKGAKAALVNVTGNKKMTMREVDAATKLIYEEAGKEVHLIFGCVVDENMDDELKNRIVGEAKFLRALHYFNLVRCYGEVPLRITPVEAGDDQGLPVSSIVEIYDSIIDDLNFASIHCWGRNESRGNYTNDLGRATNTAAHALLSLIHI